MSVDDLPGSDFDRPPFGPRPARPDGVQYESAEITSPPDRVARAWYTPGLI